MLTVKLWWVDKDGKVKATEQIPAAVEFGNCPATLVVTGGGNRFMPKADSGFRGFSKTDVRHPGSRGGRGGRGNRPENGCSCVAVLPPAELGAWYVPQAVINREITLSVDDVKELDAFQV